MAEGTNEEKLFLAISGIGAIFGFILPLVAWLLKRDEFSDYTKKFLLDMLNFELIMLIFSIALVFIPMGRLLSLVLWLFNLIIVLRVYSAARNGKEYNFPIKTEIIKE